MAFMAPLMFGTAAGVGAVGPMAATAGLLGTGGAFSAATAMGSMGTLLKVGGALGQYGAMQAQAKSQEAAAKATQQQLNYQAGQEAASAQREALARRRQADIMMSRAMAVGAASGAGTSGMEGLMAGIAGEGEEQAQYALYSGTEAAKGLRYRGQVGVAEAKQSAAATRRAATSTLLSSGASALYGRFA
jgi:hypothetical protein